MLSQKMCILLLASSELQICKATTIGNNSRTVISAVSPASYHHCGQGAHYQQPWKYTPKPRRSPAAESVNSWTSSFETQNRSWKTDIPLKCSKKCIHIVKSNLISLPTFKWWWGFVNPQMEFIKRRQKGQPGAVAHHAKSSDPIDSAFLLKKFFSCDRMF